ncbi:CaiB/BaiF CoA-transferase family protein [Ascidiaceihabitans sp.]|uniref:CaiB/BaiF CoA transferase family protein n=1 Tax=Ascidiaceihabitans sp. TaxID=1872644 RepID=UPI00329A5A9F
MTQNTQAPPQRRGPLSGLRIIEFAGIGPGPFAAMMLADMGAEVIRVDRISDVPAHPNDFTLRNRRSLALNLKDPKAIDIALSLIASADALIEGFRPGVMERLGLGPDVCNGRNPKLVYGRMTGWGQDGPWAQAAGHDLNYIALSGALWATGEADSKPTFPMNLLGDYGGGGMYLAFGIVAGILNAQTTGKGDTVDAAICDGTNSLMTFIHSRRAMGLWEDRRQANKLDGGVPWYDVYQCADGEWISIGALEPQFWAKLLEILDIPVDQVGRRDDPSTHAATRALLEQTFAAHPQAYWNDLLSGTDACYAPVLRPNEARTHPHMAARNAFQPQGPEQPSPAPRFALAGNGPMQPPSDPGAETVTLLEELGFSADDIQHLIVQGAISETQTKENAK